MPRKKPAAAAETASATATTTSGAGSGSGRKPRVNRSDFKFAVWAGNGSKPVAFCRTKEEVDSVVSGHKSNNITIGTLKQATTKRTVEW